MFNSMLLSTGGAASYAAPTNINVSIPAYVATISWTNGEPAIGLQVLRSLNDAGFVVVFNGPAGTTSITDNVVTGNKYKWAVRHSDGSRYSAAIESGSYIIPIPAPYNLVETGSTKNSISLGWANGDGTADTRIYRSYTFVGDYSLVDTVGPGVSAYTDAGLNPAVDYYYYTVHTKNGYVSNPSNTRLITTAADGPAADPSLLTATANGPNRIDLAWTNGDATATTSIERSPDGSTNWTVINTAAAGVTTYKNYNRVASTTYYYRVRHFKNTVYSAYSNIDSATTTANPTFTDFSATQYVGGTCGVTNLTNRLSFTITGSAVGWNLNVEQLISGDYHLVTSIADPVTGYYDHKDIGYVVDNLNGVYIEYNYRVSLTNGTDNGIGSPKTDMISLSRRGC